MGDARRKSLLPNVTNRQVAAQADADCTTCGGDGYVSKPLPALCACAMLNFSRRYGHQTDVRAGKRVWLEGCPRS